MPDRSKLKILFVLNPIAGGLRKTEIETAIHYHEQKGHFEYEIYITKGSYDQESIRHWVETWKPDRVVAIGGDGTLKLIAEICIDKKIPVGMIPAGSANGMAKELGLPFDIEECMDMVVNGRVENIDVIRVNKDDICLHLSDIGMNAQLVKYFEETGLRGKFGYARGVLKMFWKRSLMQVTITHDGTESKREAFMIVLANARMYGTGAVINPDGDMQDGHFEVIVVRRMTPVSLFKMFFKRGKFNRKYIEVIPVKTAEIKVEKKAYFQVDGEYRGKTTCISAVIHKQALSLLKPAATV